MQSDITEKSTGRQLRELFKNSDFIYVRDNNGDGNTADPGEVERQQPK